MRSNSYLIELLDLKNSPNNLAELFIFSYIISKKILESIFRI